MNKLNKFVRINQFGWLLNKGKSFFSKMCRPTKQDGTRHLHYMDLISCNCFQLKIDYKLENLENDKDILAKSEDFLRIFAYIGCMMGIL